jgi:L-arabinose isomerase
LTRAPYRRSYAFGPDIRGFLKRWVREGPTHHFALGVGRYAGTLRHIADAPGIESVIVTGER